MTTERGPLVGRERELGEATGALEGAASGRGRLLMLVGEPGIGVREVIRQRLDRLAGEARTLVDLAAVAGDVIDLPMLIAASERGRPEGLGQEPDHRAAIAAQRRNNRTEQHNLQTRKAGQLAASAFFA